MLIAEQLKSIMPRLSDSRNRELLPFLQAAATEFAIEAPARMAAFLAQLAHESGQFQFMEEIWGPTAAQRRYEPPSSLATDLGNTEAGDGKRFKGRGPIQITGRANYRRFGNLLRLDLVSDPGRAAVPDVAFRIAGLFWLKKGLNELADLATANAFREITRRINGGFNGLAHRQAFYAVACTVLAVVRPATARGSARALPVPGAGEEPAFERGRDAIRADMQRRRARKTRSAGKSKTRAPRSRLKTASATGRGAAAPKSAPPRRRAARPAAKKKRKTGSPR